MRRLTAVVLVLGAIAILGGFRHGAARTQPVAYAQYIDWTNECTDVELPGHGGSYPPTNRPMPGVFEWKYPDLCSGCEQSNEDPTGHSVGINLEDVDTGCPASFDATRMLYVRFCEPMSFGWAGWPIGYVGWSDLDSEEFPYPLYTELVYLNEYTAYSEIPCGGDVEYGGSEFVLGVDSLWVVWGFDHYLYGTNPARGAALVGFESLVQCPCIQ